MRYVTRDQCEECGTKKRCCDNGADLYTTKPELIEISRQDDKSNSINECTNGAREDQDARISRCGCGKKCDVRTVMLTSAMKSLGSEAPR
jgi:hypothetical protein